MAWKGWRFECVEHSMEYGNGAWCEKKQKDGRMW